MTWYSMHADYLHHSQEQCYHRFGNQFNFDTRGFCEALISTILIDNAHSGVFGVTDDDYAIGDPSQ